MAKKPLDLSIIIVHFNTPSLLSQCVNSIIAFTKGIKYEIVIVDNASSQGLDLLSQLGKKKNLTVLRNKENLGFSKGNNEGIKKAKGEYILLLNSDTLLTSNTFGNMVQWFNKHANVGVASAALRNSDGSLQATGGFFPSLFNIFSWMFFIDDIPFLISKPYHLRPGKKLRQVDWLTGAFFMIREKVVEQVGMLDPDYFMYVEDMDYCYRVKKAGWNIVYNPNESIIHLGGASSTKEFPLISEFRGILTFYKKHKPAWQYPLVKLLLKTGALLRIGILGILKGPHIGKIYAKAFQAI